MYYFPQIYNKYVPVFRAFSQDSMHVPVVMDGTFCKNPLFPVVCQNTVLSRQAPVLQAPCRKSVKAHQQLSVLMWQDLISVPVCFSYRHGHCTTALAFHSLQDIFCMVFLCSLWFPLFSFNGYNFILWYIYVIITKLFLQSYICAHILLSTITL